MGDTRRLKKKYAKPKKLWNKVQIEEERKIIKKYGLKNKMEIWRAISHVGKIRAQAKKLITQSPEAQEKFLEKLEKQGLIKSKNIETVLEMKTEDILARRLQTIVTKKFNLRPLQARQAITHGKVLVETKKINKPSYFVDLNIEKNISLLNQKSMKNPNEKILTQDKVSE
ncbi:MAG: 30S ribosomal protein S4 [Nanoarchaeota archaeon]